MYQQLIITFPNDVNSAHVQEIAEIIEGILNLDWTVEGYSITDLVMQEEAAEG